MIRQKPNSHYVMFGEQIRARVLAGELRPGAKLDSIRELAVKAGLSHITICRAIKYLVAEGVLTTRERQGLFVADRAEQRKRAGRIGVILRTWSRFVRQAAPSPTVDGTGQATIQGRLIESGCQIVLQGCITHPHEDDQDRWEHVPARELVDKRMDAIVTLGIYDFEYLNSIRAQGIPVIAHDVDASDLGIDSVFFDDLGSSFELTRVLLESGHRHIVFLGGPQKPAQENHYIAYDPSAIRRADGYRLAMRLAGLPAHIFHCPVTRFAEDFDATLKSALESLPECTAIVTEHYRDLRRFTSCKVALAFWRRPVDGHEEWPACAAATAECDPVALGLATAETVQARLENPEQPTIRRIVQPAIRLAHAPAAALATTEGKMP